MRYMYLPTIPPLTLIGLSQGAAAPGRETEPVRIPAWSSLMFAVSGIGGPVVGVMLPDHLELVIEGINSKLMSPSSLGSQLPVVLKVPFIVSLFNVAVTVVVLVLLRTIVIVTLVPLTSPVIEPMGEQTGTRPLNMTNLELMLVPVWIMNMSTLVG